MPRCAYCREVKPFTDEHVLTRAFAGQGENWTLVDTVCGDCNAAFSLCERAWTSAPGEAMARIYHGPAGRKRKGQSYRLHPAEHVYMIQEGDPIAYEAEILDGLTPRVRPQLIWTGNDVLALAPTAEDGPRLQAAFDAFARRGELTVYKHPNATKMARFLIAKLGRMPRQQTPCLIGYEWRDTPADAWLDHFPARSSREPFYCRSSIDQDDRVRIRAENIETAITFLRETKDRKSSGSGIKLFPAGYTVHVEQLLDTVRMSRAIAKTGFNLGIKLLGKDVMADAAFDLCRTYCWSGAGDDPRHPFVGLIVDEAEIVQMPQPICVRDERRHVLMLASDGHRLISLIRLYGGPVFRVHLGAAHIAAFEKAVVVDYSGSGIRAV